GIAADGVSFDMAAAGQHRDRVVKTLTGGVGGLFKKNKVEVLEGHGALAGPGKVTVGNREVETGKIVLATGSLSLPIPGASFGGEKEKFDYLCIAAGRGPDVENLGLDKAGVKMGERGMVEVDDRMRTSADGVYAIGDLIHGPMLAHKASDEGIIAVEDAAGL